MAGTDTSLGFEVRMSGPFERAVETVTARLKEAGFGTLTEIDLQAAFAEKLGVDFRRYRILGACNPKLAHAAVTAHPEIGLLLPCNVTVEEADDGSVVVRITDPRTLFAAAAVEADGSLAGIVTEAHRLLAGVADRLAGG